MKVKITEKILIEEGKAMKYEDKSCWIEE